MYLNCASNTRNIQVSDRDLESADTQYSMTLIGSGHKKPDRDIPSSKQMSLDFDVRGQQVIDFYLWRKCYYGLRARILASLKLKCLNDTFVSYKLTAFHFNCWTGVVWITLGCSKISFLGELFL